MGFDIGKVFEIAGKAVPLIITAIGAVERIKNASGPEKKDAVMGSVPGILMSVEAIAGDFANDAKVMEAASKFIDAYVAFDKAVKEAEALVRRAKEIPN